MKITILSLLLTVTSASLAQTERHQAVQGTKVSLIPPDRFVQATSFSGFQNHTNGASIMVNELAAPVQEIIAGFTTDALMSEGITLIDKQTINFNNSDATFLKVSQPFNGIIYLKQILIFGDDKKTILVNGIYPEASKSIEQDIKTALLSVSYNENQSDNPLEAAKFKIDVSGSDFKFSKFMAGSLLYTTDGKVPTESADKAMFIAGNSIGLASVDDRKQYCLDRLKNLSRGESNIPKEINPVTIDNLPGIEIVAEGKDPDNNNLLVYQTMLFTDDGEYYIFVGSTTDNFDSYLNTFRKIVNTFKRK